MLPPECQAIATGRMWTRVRAAAPRGAASLDVMSERPVVAVLHNLERPFLGHAGPALEASGLRLDERFLRGGDPLPEPGEVDGIVVLGGEQTAADPALGPQAALLREATGRGVPVLGVCL